MLYREIMAVCSEIHTKHINTVFEQNVQSVNVKIGSAKYKTELQKVKCTQKICARSSKIRYDSCWPACVGSNTANHRCNGPLSVGARLPMWLHAVTAQGKCGGVSNDSAMCTVIAVRVSVVS